MRHFFIFLTSVLIFSACGVKGDPLPLFRDDSAKRQRSSMGAIPASPEPTPSLSPRVSE